MKIHKYFCLFMMLMLGLSFISCSKDDGDEVFDDRGHRDRYLGSLFRVD